MSEQSYTPQLRPLSIGETLDAGFRLFRHRFGTLLACALVPTVPLCILFAILIVSTLPEAFDPNATSTEPTDEEAGAFLAGFVILGLLFGIGSLMAIAACFKVISAAYLGERATVGSSLRFGLRRALPLIGAYLLMSLALAPLNILSFLIIPALVAIWLQVRWAMAFPAIIAERAGPIKAMGRSWALTRNHWWRTFATLLVLFIIAIVLWLAIIFGLSLAIAAVAESMGALAAAALTTLQYTIVLGIVFPLAASILTVIYFDLRVRNEGFDLELLARGVGGDASRFERAPELPVPPTTPGSASGPGGFTAPEGPTTAS